MVIDLPRVAAILDRIAADIDELARARRVQDLNTAAALPDPRAERRRRLAELDLEFRAFCIRRRLPASSTPQLERAWEGYGQDKHETHSGAGLAVRRGPRPSSAPGLAAGEAVCSLKPSTRFFGPKSSGFSEVRAGGWLQRTSLL